MPRLTKKVVDGAEPAASPFFIWCSDLPGFGVRVFPSGKRVYYADYRNRAGGRKRMSIGPHGKLTTEEARKLAISTLGDVLRGEDPAEERATRRKSMTVRELCDKYLAAAEAGAPFGKRSRPKKASTLETDRGRIERHIKPLLGTKAVRDLTPGDVARFIRDVTAGKTAVVEKTDKLRGKSMVAGGAGTAARTSGLLGGILSFAVLEGVIPINPAIGVKRPAGTPRERRLSADEYRQLGRALEQAEAEGEIPQAVSGVWLLALTGCRLEEIEKLLWSAVDKAGGCFRLADSKEGASVRPISPLVFERLDGIARVKGCPYVLPAARSSGSYGGMPGAMERIVARAKLEGVSAHTLRHSFSSVAGDLNYSLAVIGSLIGHKAGGTTGRYVHLDTVLIAAADKVARAVHAQMVGVEGKVIQMPVRASNG